MFIKLVLVIQFGIFFCSESAVLSTDSDILPTSLSETKTTLLRPTKRDILNTDDLKHQTQPTVLTTFPTHGFILNATILEKLNHNRPSTDTNLNSNKIGTNEALSTFPTKGYIATDLSILRNLNKTAETSTVPNVFPNDTEKFNIIRKNKTLIDLLNHNVSNGKKIEENSKNELNSLENCSEEKSNTTNINCRSEKEDSTKISTVTQINSQNITLNGLRTSKNVSPQEIFPTDSTKFTIVETNDNVVKNLTHETTDSEVIDLNSNESYNGEYDVDQITTKTDENNQINRKQPDKTVEKLLHDNEDKNIAKNETHTNREQSDTKPKAMKGEIAEILVSVFVMIAIFGYIALVFWRKSLEYRYGNRELLVNEEEYSRYDNRFEL